MKLCSRLLMHCGRNFCDKRQLWVSKPHFGEVRSDARLWLMVCWKACGHLPILVNWIFRYLLRFQSYKAKCEQLGCFRRRSTSLHSNFTWRGSSSTNHTWWQKTADTGLPAGENASLCIPSFWHNTRVWRTDRQTDGRTDGRICRSIYSVCKASFAARCKNDLLISLSCVPRLEFCVTLTLTVTRSQNYINHCKNIQSQLR